MGNQEISRYLAPNSDDLGLENMPQKSMSGETWLVTSAALSDALEEKRSSSSLYLGHENIRQLKGIGMDF